MPTTSIKPPKIRRKEARANLDKRNTFEEDAIPTSVEESNIIKAEIVEAIPHVANTNYNETIMDTDYEDEECVSLTPPSSNSFNCDHSRILKPELVT